MSTLSASELGTRISGFRAEVVFQLVTVLIVAVGVVIALVVDPAPLKTTAFVIAIGIVAAATVLAVVIGRTDSEWLLLVPVLDMFALVVMWHVPEHHVHPLFVLAVLPAVWLGWSGRRVFAGLAVLLSLGLLEFPPTGGVLDLEHALRNFLTPAVVAVVALSTYVASNRTRASIQSLIVQERETAAALEREKSTSRLLDAILDAVNIGIIAYDADGRQILANRTVQGHPVVRGTGLTPLELDQQGHMLQLDRSTPVPAERGIITRALRGDEYSNQIVWTSAPGTRQYALAASARPLLDGEGRFGGTVIAIDDVTAYLETIAAKDEFVGSVSHEFRTPLASLVGYLELILEEENRLPDDVRQHLAVMERNIDRLQRIVHDLLEAASETTRAVRLQREATDVVALCERVLARCGPAAEKAGMLLELEAEGPVTAVIDPRRVGQAVDTLVTNALTFSPCAGRIVVSVTSDGEAVSIVVRDTGIGMPSEELDALTSPFYRPTASREHFPGVGLRLTVTKAILEEHRGSLTFDSADGEGTTATATVAVR